MMGWYRRLLPREDKFFELFEQQSGKLVKAAAALDQLLKGNDVEGRSQEIFRLEDEADEVTRNVLEGLRKSFITPFDRTDIKDLIQSMDDAIDTMRKTVKTVQLYEQTQFEPLMQEIGKCVVDAARLTHEAIPLLAAASANAQRLSVLASEIGADENKSDDLYDRGLKELYHKNRRADPMAYMIGKEIYADLEKVVDRFEDIANEISAIVIENV
jgi:predicted phosphate transport protein (TIGR00153 family)